MWMDDPDDEFFEEEDLGPSKSQLKRDSHALQDLGDELMKLTPEQLARLDLPEELAEAVRIGRGITAHGGLRRQRKFIGKLLRQMDAEPIRAGLAALRNESADAVRLQHLCERWRDRMLAEGDAAVNEFVGDHPEADRQKLRQLVREGKREKEAGKPPRAARLLFRYLREVLGAGQEVELGGEDTEEGEED
jgi:ribosome-associated protein